MATVACDFVSPPANPRRWRAAVEVALIFLVFFIHAGWPVPDVNEPHGLCKARHFWDAQWCGRDFFLGTADAHAFFYFSFGWMTLLFPLPAAAWCGRIITWLLLAWAWRRLSTALVEGWLYCVLSAALFVTLNGRLHMAGEWVVGGVEAKGFAYVLVFLGIEAVVRDRWGWGLVAFGAASAVHVIVGGWAIVAAAIAWLAADQRPGLGRLLLPAAAGLSLALLGLWPALALTWHAEPQVIAQANRLYVYERLYHHLSPAQMPVIYVVRHLLLVGALVPLVWLAPQDARFRRLRSFAAAGVAIASAGMLIGLAAWWNADLAAGLLRYYWFRSSDVMVPLAAALLGTAVVYDWQREQRAGFALALCAATAIAGWHLGETVCRRQGNLVPPADAGVANLDDWREVCRWAAAETPADALFLVPRMAHTFRWYSGRAEVVTRKDVPQDAAGIVAWWRRLTEIYPEDHTQPRRYAELSELGAERLQALGARYGADYVVTSPWPRLPLERVGPHTPTVAVYALGRPARLEEQTPP